MINQMKYALSILLLLPYFTVANSLEFTLDDAPSIDLMTDFKGSDLCAVAENTSLYLSQYPQDKFAVHSGSVVSSSLTLTQVKNTLEFICRVYREDVKAKRQSRLHDKNFIKENFNFYRWLPDTERAKSIAQTTKNKVKSRLLNNIPTDKIFLTKYYTKLLEGSEYRTDVFNQALYELPADEQGLTLEQAQQKKHQLTRFKYTRQQIIGGALRENNQAKPLVWISEEALHDVLLQGTGVLKVNGKIRYFNVHRNNGIAYDYHIGKREQGRYWYFAEVPNIMGYGKTLKSKIAVRPQVTFAGNVAQLGLGKLLMINVIEQGQSKTRLGILADQGGAFDNNLFQLDLLVDSYFGWDDYYKANRSMPDYAKAWIMLMKN